MCCRRGPEACPQQQNGYDCGAFLCMCALHAVHDMELLFTQADMQQFRSHIGWRLLKGDDWDK